jgi:hypothetical protein
MLTMELQSFQLSAPGYSKTVVAHFSQLWGFVFLCTCRTKCKSLDMSFLRLRLKQPNRIRQDCVVGVQIKVCRVMDRMELGQDSIIVFQFPL